MTALTDYAEGQTIGKMFRGDATAFPATWYVGLFSATPGEAGGGTELSGNAYARVAVASGAGNWAAPAGGNATTSNVSAITFPVPTGAWATATHFGVFDAATAGNLWIYAALTTAKTAASGDTVSFPAAALTIQIDN